MKTRTAIICFVLFGVGTACGFALRLRQSAGFDLPLASPKSPATPPRTSTLDADAPAQVAPASTSAARAKTTQQLLMLKGTVSPADWRAMVYEHQYRERPYLNPEFMGAVARWEDPKGTIRLAAIEAWKGDPTGKHAKSVMEGLSDQYAAYSLTVPENIAGDWVASADFAASIANLTPTESARLVDQTVEKWIAAEGSEYAAVWLHSHAGNPAFDMARETVLLANHGNSALLMSEMSNDAARQHATDELSLNETLLETK